MWKIKLPKYQCHGNWNRKMITPTSEEVSEKIVGTFKKSST
jgi:hypothetical protein